MNRKYEKIFIVFVLFFLTEFIHIGINCHRIKEAKVHLPDLGEVQGSKTKTAWTQQTIYQFLAIPFAESPSGQLRFKPPVPRQPWRNLFLATQNGRPCPSPDYIRNLSNQELRNNNLEDCLHLSIYTKNLHVKKPVMVFIHGGGYYTGTANEHPPNYLLEKDIVLVVPQYRLGILGFGSTMSNEIPGNVAVLDILLALRWIRKNIEYFGGDFNEITLFGQSAGAALINVFMYSPFIPKNLFKRAITQSGSFLSTWAYNTDPIKLTESTCVQLNCTGCQELNMLNKCLMDASILDLFTKNNNTESYSLTVGDINNILPTIPLNMVQNRKSQYPMMTGVTKQEGSFVLAIFYDYLISQYGNLTSLPSHDIIDMLILLCGEKDESGSLNTILKKLLFNTKQLSQRNFTDLIPGLIDLSSILVIKSSVLRLAQLHTKLSKQQTYLYTFDYQGSNSRFGYGNDNTHYPFDGGVHHSDDNLYLFKYYFDLNHKDTKMAKQMVDLWTSFAITGVPQSSTVLDWEPLTNETGMGPYIHINENISYGNNFLDEYLATDKNIIRKTQV